MRCRVKPRWVTKGFQRQNFSKQFLGGQTKRRAIQARDRPAALVGSPSGKAGRGESGKTAQELYSSSTASHHAHAPITASHWPVMLARIRRIQHAQTLQVFIVAQAAQGGAPALSFPRPGP